jgi:beta-lactam-binding protein with PASTA domain/tRNA A-37 threonylcarbamoyl transferase component Bud32
MEPVNDSPRVLGNRYEVGEVLGRGGMAEVHIGRDARLGRTVAIKLLRSDLARDPTFQARFRREAQSAASLNHPAVVAVYDTGEEQVVDTTGALVPLPFIVMEYVHGRTVRDLIEQARTRAAATVAPGQPTPPGAGALDISTTLDITMGVLAALEYSHRAGIVHRDIKPANVMVTPTGEVKVMDFGIARALADASTSMTQTQAVIGTAQYLSPEQARGEQVDARSDLYSAGCLLYELLTGRPPFVADSPVAVAYQHVREYAQPPSTLNPAVTEDIDRIVMHALTKDRDIRYQTATEFRYDIEAVRAGRRVAAPSLAGAAAGAARTTARPAQTTAGSDIFPVDQPYGTDEPEKRRALLYAVIATGVLLAASLITYALLHRGDDKPTLPTQVSVPNVVNETSAYAKKAIEDAGFVYKPESEPSDDTDEGHVTRTDPAAGVMLNPTSTVTVYVSTGPSAVEVPDVTGMSQDEAKTELEKYDLVLGRVDSDEKPKVKKDEVFATEPAAGKKVKPGTSVTVFVGTGLVKLPNVVGLSLKDAKKILEDDLGLTVVPENSPSAERPPGEVLAQDPFLGTLVPIDSSVTLTIAEKPKVTPTTTTTTTPPTTTTTEPAQTPTPSTTPPEDGGQPSP